jgi:hypothetical protein
MNTTSNEKYRAQQELDGLKAEIEEFNKEKERIKTMIGQIGGKSYSRRDTIINIVFIISIAVLFVLEFTTDLFPTLMSLEFGILLVSVKIIFMIHTQQKTNHFQFWVLNTIEFRINQMDKRIRTIEKSVTEQ